MALNVSNGLKKPLNQLENPVYPDIRRQPPRFQWARKHWEVSVGDVMKDLQADTQHTLNDAVLAQSRDYNQFRYGVSSHKDVVNKAFRPPLVTQEDLMPLNRLPRPAIIPHSNPGTADGGGYQTQNTHRLDIGAHLTDRVQTGELHPTFYCPIDLPDDNSVLPDLEYKLPQVSADAGCEMHISSLNSLENQERHIDYHQLHAHGDAGLRTEVRIDGQNGMEGLTLDYNTPQVSGDAGFRSQFTVDGETPTEIPLDYNRPQVSGDAGYRSQFTVDGETPTEIPLDYNRPQVSGDAGLVTHITGESRSMHENARLINKRMLAPEEVHNPAPIGFDPRENYALSKGQMRIHHGRINRSVEVAPNYRVGTEVMRNFQAPVAQRRKSEVTSRITGNVTSEGYLPRTGVEMPQLRHMTDRGPPKRKVAYKF